MVEHLCENHIKKAPEEAENAYYMVGLAKTIMEINMKQIQNIFLQKLLWQRCC
jgi:hypothetical protein